MRSKSLLMLVGAIVVVVVLLFDVTIAFEFALPAEQTVADLAQEEHYAACYAAQDEEIHKTAFGTIDNPDVQKEFITSNRTAAARECRAQFPEQVITESTPFRFNLIDLQPRYW